MDISDEEMAPIIKKDGNFKLDLLTWRKNVREGNIAEDPGQVGKVMEDILKGGGQAKMWEAISAGVIKTPESMQKAASFIDLADKANKAPAKVLETAAARSYLGIIETMGADSKFSPASIMGKPALTQGGRQALNDYRYGLMQWQAKHPDASPLEQEQYAASLGETIIKGLTATAPDGKTLPQGTYVKPAELQGTPSTQPMQAPPQPTPSAPSQPSNWHQKVMESSEKPAIEGLGMTPAERADVDALAKASNGTAQEIVDRIWRKGRGAAPPSPAPTITNPSERSTGPRSSIDLPGGLGQIQLVGLRPEHMEMVQSAVRGLTFPMKRPSPQDASNSGNEIVSARRVAQIDALPVGRVIESVARRLGFDHAKAKVIASIESSGNPDSGRGKAYKGLFQLNKSEWQTYGRDGGDIHDAEANAEAGIKSMMDKSRKFTNEFGREPSATELYLMHQQGEAGLRAHATNPDAPAWENMRGTGEGRNKGDSWAKRAIWGNVPTDLKGRFGSVDNITSREFIAVWTSKLLGISYDEALAMDYGGKSRNV